MKCKILLFPAFIVISFFANAQSTGKTYAITGKATNSFFWADIKQVDIATGKVVKTLFEADKTPFKTVSLEKSTEANSAKSIITNPTGLGVAACALDVLHNRLYFAPMHFSEIRYLDLSKADANFTTVKSKVIASPDEAVYQSEENQLTRMVIAADGYGYALTNDGNHLIRFSTGKKPIVQDLGSVIDAAENNGLSIHNKCSSWGGDMVADAFGKLVIVAASHNVFTVDVTTRVATFKGTITGLPANFTTNGAAVDNDGFMVVSSANVFDALYKVDTKNLVATKVPSTELPFNASDLANGNFLLQKEADELSKFSLNKLTLPLATISDAKVFPNPVTGASFQVLFAGQETGKYTIILTDLAGRSLQSQVVSVSKATQTATVIMENKQAKGTYVVTVLNSSKQIAFTQKLIIN